MSSVHARVDEQVSHINIHNKGGMFRVEGGPKFDGLTCTADRTLHEEPNGQDIWVNDPPEASLSYNLFLP